MKDNLLQHPVLQALEPESPREILLFIKAHTIGTATTLDAIRYHGLENIEALYHYALPDMWQNIDTIDNREKDVKKLV